MRLADFISDNLDLILNEWDAFARNIAPPAESMSNADLRDHAMSMLKAIADDLRTSQSRDAQAAKSRGLGPVGAEDEAGSVHGIARLALHFRVEQLVSEYRALRASVLRLWSDSNRIAESTDLHDLTRFNEAIDQLLAAAVGSFAQQQRQALDKERERRDEFLAMLAHELRNPLAPIKSAAKLLSVADGDLALIRRASEIIDRQVAHMTGLVNDLLDVSRVTRGLISLKHEAIDLNGAIADAVEQVTPLIEGRHHQLTVQRASEPMLVWGDRNRLVQIIANLLTNAAKYTNEGGHIQVTTARCGDAATLTVRDDGIGLTPDLMENMFEPFTQARRAPDRFTDGLGLGLALVKSLVELHDGKVKAASAGADKGSEFTISLPGLPGQKEQPATPASAAQQGPAEG